VDSNESALSSFDACDAGRQARLGTRPTARMGSTEAFCHRTDRNLPGAVWCRPRTHRPMLQGGVLGQGEPSVAAAIMGAPSVLVLAATGVPEPSLSQGPSSSDRVVRDGPRWRVMAPTDGSRACYRIVAA
jgi:hypothetical protein